MVKADEQAFREQQGSDNQVVARTLKDAKTLLECGFEYVTDYANYKLFRKH